MILSRLAPSLGPALGGDGGKRPPSMTALVPLVPVPVTRRGSGPEQGACQACPPVFAHRKHVRIQFCNSACHLAHTNQSCRRWLAAPFSREMHSALTCMLTPYVVELCPFLHPSPPLYIAPVRTSTDVHPGKNVARRFIIRFHLHTHHTRSTVISPAGAWLSAKWLHFVAEPITGDVGDIHA